LKNEIKKITKIIDEVINYFMFHYKPFVAMTIDCKGDTFFISFVFKDLKLSDEEFDKIKSKFKLNRRVEIEDYYWQLVGDSENASEFTLVSLMSDEIQFSKDDESVYLTITRKKSKK